MNQSLSWHPQWLVYQHKQMGMVLINESKTLWLPQQQFPGLSLINDKRSALDINMLLSQQANDPHQGAIFLHKLRQLHKAQAIISTNDKIVDDYCLLEQKSSAIWLMQSPQLSTSDEAERGVSILSLSSQSEEWLQLWVDILSQNISAIGQKTTFILVDDLLDRRLKDVTFELENYMVIKISGSSFDFCPVSSLTDERFEPLDWGEFAEQLSQNQPVRKTFSRLYPQQSSALPILKNCGLKSAEFSLEVGAQIQSILATQLESKEKKLVAFVFDWQAVESPSITEHPVLLRPIDSLCMSEQIAEPVMLDTCVSVFDQDGGSRSMTPKQTVERLEACISPVTGAITHLETLTTFAEDPIKIYQTAFYKTPTAIECQQIDGESFTQTCMGKGVSNIQSKASALCETIERSNAHYRDDVVGLLMPYSQMKQQHLCVAYQQLADFSQHQYQKFNDNYHPDSSLKQAVKPYRDTPIRWLPTWSLTRSRQVWVPLSLCFSQVPYPDVQFGRWQSNGCAAGNTIEEATLQALLELIERDAAAIWWYNQTPRQAFELEKIEPENLNTLTQSLSHSHEFWVLDITTDIGIPAMVAIGKHKQNGGFIMGMGCHLKPELAAQRALTELCQLIPIRDQNGAPFDFDAMESGEHLFPATTKSAAIEYQLCDSKDIKQQIEYITRALQQLDFDTLVFNYSRAHIPLKTIKVFVPGLTHIWPQLGNQRLYQTPLKMGLLAKALDEHSINSQALYI